jgi:hypothetical protein
VEEDRDEGRSSKSEAESACGGTREAGRDVEEEREANTSCGGETGLERGDEENILLVGRTISIARLDRIGEVWGDGTVLTSRSRGLTGVGGSTKMVPAVND